MAESSIRIENDLGQNSSGRAPIADQNRIRIAKASWIMHKCIDSGFAF